MAGIFQGLGDGSVEGGVLQDSARQKACEDAVKAALTACNFAAANAARDRCLDAWTDKAAIDGECGSATGVPCANFSGRCVNKGTWICTKVGNDGDACSFTKPCAVNLACNNTALTRATQCGKPNSTCNLSDKCLDGDKCDNGKCIADSGGLAIGAACGKSEDCKTTAICSGGKCVSKMCSL